MLTHRQRDCLSAINAHIDEVGRPPSLGELAARLKLRSRGRVRKLVDGLIERGFITRRPHVPYGIERVYRTQFFKFNEERKALEPMGST